jgi:hypothetical protein
MNEGLQDDGKFSEFLSRLNSLDFGPLAYKLMHAEDRPGLSFEQSLDAIKKYKGFLFLCHAYQGKTISPSRYVDYVWHCHMMDSELYMVQTGILFGRYLHHFPYFGKRGGTDQADLLSAAEFTRRQAEFHFGWDDDDWCGNDRRLRPRPGQPGPTDLLSVLFPAGADFSDVGANPDRVTIEAGNFRHTIEHLNLSPTMSLTSRWNELASKLKLPIWVIVCMPPELGILNEIFTIRNVDKLGEIAAGLAGQRPAPQGYTNALVELQAGAQIQGASQ